MLILYLLLWLLIGSGLVVFFGAIDDDENPTPEGYLGLALIWPLTFVGVVIFLTVKLVNKYKDKLDFIDKVNKFLFNQAMKLRRKIK